MKRMYAAAITAATLTLAACGQSAPSFDSPAEFMDAVDATGVECENFDNRRVSDGVTYIADCYDDTGTGSTFIMFEDQSAQDGWLKTVRADHAVHDVSPAALVGEEWIIRCDSEDLCEEWADGLGGSVVTAPNY